MVAAAVIGDMLRIGLQIRSRVSKCVLGGVYSGGMVRQGNRPNRRIAKADMLDPDGRRMLAERLAYSGSAHHKRSPGDYGFHPPVNPRPSKSLCDGLRSILKAEAKRMLREGVSMGMFSAFEGEDMPKYVWCVDSDGEAYEAIIGQGGYHGYRLYSSDDLRAVVLKEWKKRCQVD